MLDAVVMGVRLDSRTRSLRLAAFCSLGLIAGCKVFDASLVPDGGEGSNADDSGTCSLGAEELCNGIDDDCDDEIDEDTNLTIDVSHCGACGRACSFANSAVGECADSICVNACDNGWDDCNQDDADGCEANLSSRASCTSCDLTCPFACDAGACVSGRAVTAGVTWTCATFETGTARCWGSNVHGWLGTGDTNPSLRPRNVSALTDATQLVAGFGHTCALRRNRVASCWGENERGQLGNNTTLQSTSPVNVALSNVDDISVGNGHTCVRSGTSLFCWGFNDAGQLGFGDNENRPSPEALPATIGLIRDVSTGLAHTCAVRESGEVVCFGFNDQGQSGSATGVQVITPTVIGGVDDAIQVTLGHAHSCVLTESRRVRCWGWNGAGQLGDGGFASRSQPLFVLDETGAQLSGVERLVAGARRTCAVTNTQPRAAYCWGDNTSGALGAGPTPGQVPNAVKVTALGAEEIFDVAVGDRHTCFLGTTRIGCVGDNQQGQLGDGTVASSTSAVDVSL